MSLSFTFFSTEAAPPSLAEYEAQAQDFISKWLLAESCHLVVITSGGTSVPLEAETVRFVDNFSTGRRGATMAEHFINEDYWVIFVSRPSSQQPFVRHLTPAGHLETRLLEKFSLLPGQQQSNGGKQSLLAWQHENKDIVTAYMSFQKSKDRLLVLSFTTVVEYLFLLRLLAQVCHQAGPRCVFVLCAAVSDFYLPSDKMSHHKIQSSVKTLNFELFPVPKLLGMLRASCHDALIVSFKLETDGSLLRSKAVTSLTTYGSDVVRKSVYFASTMTQTVTNRLSEISCEVDTMKLLSFIAIRGSKFWNQSHRTTV
eukprot:GHVQ01013603.1.p1 GENE.GHVQ01013603.1~~GHVQ01013603.1.p1  ORF type:complete len:313 (-),score=25.01 GHVQ01013603.1:366-1304(-)